MSDYARRLGDDNDDDGRCSGLPAAGSDERLRIGRCMRSSRRRAAELVKTDGRTDDVL
jgi:hypothetical protein